MLTYLDFMTEDLGLVGVPKNLTDFKIEVSADPDNPFATVTCTYFLDKTMLEKATKRYHLVEIEDDKEVDHADS